MPFYKVPAAVTSGDNGPRRIRAPLRHSVNNGGVGGASVSRDSDVISSDKFNRATSHSSDDQVVIGPLCIYETLVDISNTNRPIRYSNFEKYMGCGPRLSYK